MTFFFFSPGALSILEKTSMMLVVRKDGDGFPRHESVETFRKDSRKKKKEKQMENRGGKKKEHNKVESRWDFFIIILTVILQRERRGT